MICTEGACSVSLYRRVWLIRGMLGPARQNVGPQVASPRKFLFGSIHRSAGVNWHQLFYMIDLGDVGLDLLLLISGANI